jgi:epoxyqueuosine reductase
MLKLAAIHEKAAELGFNLVGAVRAAPSPHLSAYLAWIEAQMHGSMGYMARPDRVARRKDLHIILPDAATMILVGLDYHTLHVPDALATDPSRGRIAAYAWGADYHAVMEPRLAQLAVWIAAAAGEPTSNKVYVDTGAILERSHAQGAGLGFIGKNTMLINPRRGSGFFLGEILTTVALDAYDQPAPETRCGRCTRCLTGCPTGAFPEPYVLDARRCISYLTIEHKGSIDPALRPLMGNWVYGCDVCQAVCPWNRFAVQTQEARFIPPPGDVDRIAPPLALLLELDEAHFQDRFGGSAIARIGRARLVRNACIAARNSGFPTFDAALRRLLTDSEPIVREAALWALDGSSLS